MKKLACIIVLIQCGFITAQTKTMVTMYGEKVQINPNSLATANNGLTATNGNVQLGGSLVQPTTITASTTNTLALSGLQSSVSEADNLIVADPATGVLRTTSNSSVTGMRNIIRKTSNYTIAPATDNVILVDAASNNVTITVPPGVVTGREFTIKRVDTSANDVTITFGGASGTVDETDTFISVGNKVTYRIINSGNDKWQTISRF
nr:hypothetical protein [Flavobacterium sp. ASV13]